MASGRSVREEGAAGGGSLVCAPLAGGGRVLGCVYLDGRGRDRFTADDLDALALLARHGAALHENLGNRRRLHRERESLKGRLAARDETIIRSDKMVKLYEDIRTIAPIGVPVFISGEAGSGKELVASALHAFSGRKGPTSRSTAPPSRRPCSRASCSAHAGALFTRPRTSRASSSWPRAARSSSTRWRTWLSPSSPSCSASPRTARSPGWATPARKLDVRVVTATNRDVAALIAANRFRDDLFQRLSCFTLHVPPLRERLEDIEPLSRYFLGRFAREYNWPEPRLADSALQALCRCQWPGNVRQLRNVLLRLAVQAQGRQIGEREVLVAVDGPGGLSRPGWRPSHPGRDGAAAPAPCPGTGRGQHLGRGRARRHRPLDLLPEDEKIRHFGRIKNIPSAGRRSGQDRCRPVRIRDRLTIGSSTPHFKQIASSPPPPLSDIRTVTPRPGPL